MHVWLSEVFSEVILKMGHPKLHLIWGKKGTSKRIVFSSWEAQLDHIWRHAFRSEHLLHQSDIYQSGMTTNLRNQRFQSIWLLLAWSKNLFNVQTLPQTCAAIIPFHPPLLLSTSQACHLWSHVEQPQVTQVSRKVEVGRKLEDTTWLATLWFLRILEFFTSSSSRKIHPWLHMCIKSQQGPQLLEGPQGFKGQCFPPSKKNKAAPAGRHTHLSPRHSKPSPPHHRERGGKRS